MAVCTKHSDSETGLSCSTCDRPFCHLCLHQGPVGSKCRDCSKGIPITTTTRERTTANVAYVAKDRLFALKAVMATVLAIDALVLLASKTDFLSLTGSYTGANKYSLSAWSIQHGEPWRLVTGAIGNGSAITMAINLALVWFVGRLVAPQMPHAHLIALSVAAWGAGALALLFVDVQTPGFSGFALAGGYGAAYYALRRRNLTGKLRAPSIGRYGFALFFVGGTAISALMREQGALQSFAAGAIVVGLLTWFLSEPLRRKEASSQTTTLVAFVAIATFACAGVVAASAQADEPLPPTPSANDVMGQVGAMLEGEKTPTDGEWLTVTSWEERTDTGDYQTFHVQCFPTPTFRAPDPFAAINKQAGYERPATIIDAKAICDWLGTHPEALTAQEPSTCSSILIWRKTVRGSYNGKKLSALFEGDDEGCGTPLALEANKVLSEDVEATTSNISPSTSAIPPTTIT